MWQPNKRSNQPRYRAAGELRSYVPDMAKSGRPGTGRARQAPPQLGKMSGNAVLLPDLQLLQLFNEADPASRLRPEGPLISHAVILKIERHHEYKFK